MYYLKSNYYIRGILFLRLLFIFCFLRVQKNNYFLKRENLSLYDFSGSWA